MNTKINLLLFVLLFFGMFESSGQQNFFNVPSSDITTERKIFFQQQFNINRDLDQSNTTLCYGLGANSEIGLNFIGLDFNPKFHREFFLTNGNKNEPPVYPVFLVNGQKLFELSKIFKVALGVQGGLSDKLHFCSYSYLNLKSEFARLHTKVITGLYFGNKNYLGIGEANALIKELPVGVQTGIEQTIVREKLLFIAENISGSHTLGESTVGFAFYVTGHWIISCGYQFPNPKSLAARAEVFEITYAPFQLAHKKAKSHFHRET